MAGKCSIRGCGREAKKRNMCLSHYKRWKDNGDDFDKSPIVDVKDTLSRFNSKLGRRNKNGCIIWLGWKNHDGYGKFSIGNKYQFAHRFSYELFVGKIPDKKNVLHKCDVRDCCNPKHLYVGTQKDNVIDCYTRKRRSNLGSKNGYAKLKEKDVIYIKSMLGKISCAQLARDFKVSESCIRDIKHGRSWRNV